MLETRAHKDIVDLKFTSRETAKADDAELTQLKKNALEVLAKLINDNSNSSFESQLLEDFEKIKNLNLLNIPRENGKIHQYCTLTESVGGVTEKVSLIELENTKNRLKTLINEIKTLQDYAEKRDEIKLYTRAIIKMPKSGKVTEIQHEATALNISRLLGFDTTQSTMLIHDNKPALFVPFDEIELLSDFVESKPTEAVTEKKESSHYSTIKSVGEKLQADQTIEDFGKTMGFFYLCNDPDAIGGYAQNKALKNRKIFIFDQVIMEPKIGESFKVGEQFFSLDSRLSLEPTHWFRHSRHFRGRNRTLIEDSSFDAKFESIIHLIKNKDAILSMLQSVTKQHNDEMDKLDKKSDKYKTLVKLRDDSKENTKMIERRINQLFDKFPKMDDEKISTDLFLKNADTIKHALIFEKLMNYPRLFTEDGRPYKHPWTYRNKNAISNIQINKDGNVELIFSDKLDKNYLISLITQTGMAEKSIQIDEINQSILISIKDLQNLQEDALFPEQKVKFDKKLNYLNSQELTSIAKAYGEGQQKEALMIIESYNQSIEGLNVLKKIELMEKTLENIKNLVNKAKDKGFIKHVIKKLEFDIQKQLQKIFANPNLNISELNQSNLKEAFDAAIKLDRVDRFNQVLMTAIKRNFTNDAALKSYFENCINSAKMAVDYHSSKKESDKLDSDSQKLVKEMAESLRNMTTKKMTDSALILRILTEESGVTLQKNTPLEKNASPIKKSTLSESTAKSQANKAEESESKHSNLHIFRRRI